MEAFYLIVLGVATVILILILTFIGILMQSQNKGQVWPPVVNTCPDNWTVDGSGNCTIPSSISEPGYSNMGSTPSFISASLEKYKLEGSTSKLDPKHSAWAANGASTECAQKAWTQKYGILWDGISNYNGC